MQFPIPSIAAVLSICFATIGLSGDQSGTSLPELRTEHKEKQDEQGQITTRIETVYRGSQRILQTVRFKKEHDDGWGMWRTFYVDGEAVLSESDEGDGTPQTITVFNETGVYDMFKRQPDGSAEPVSSQELARFNREMSAFIEGFGTVLEAVRDRVERSGTNSVEEVIDDLKSELEEYKQKQAKEKATEE